VTPHAIVYIPAKDEDCFCSQENLRTQQPKSLLERSLFFMHKDDFVESSTLEEPIVSQWYGQLPSCSPFKHLLRLTKLTGWEGVDQEGKPIIPFRLKGMSHEIHSLYHLKRNNQSLRLLFRMQIGAPQDTAIQLARKIATEMESLPSHQGYLLLRPTLESYKRDRWAEFISLHLEKLIRSLGK
jgi:hypothetical protein